MTQIRRTTTITDSNGRPILRPKLLYLSYGFKATRKKGSNHVHVDYVEEYPRALESDIKVHKDKDGNYSCLFMYKYLADAERERWNFETLEKFYKLSQKELYDRYVKEWNSLKSSAGPSFRMKYLYKLTFSADVHYAIMRKRVKVTPEKLLRLIQANQAIFRFLTMLESFNRSNGMQDYSLGRKPPL